jgi:hypothetical protein
VTILWIGLFAGTLDITDNLIFNQLRGIMPTMVFRYIASGLIGMKAARAGGWHRSFWAVAIHYLRMVPGSARNWIAAMQLRNSSRVYRPAPGESCPAPQLAKNSFPS